MVPEQLSSNTVRQKEILKKYIYAEAELHCVMTLYVNNLIRNDWLILLSVQLKRHL